MSNPHAGEYGKCSVCGIDFAYGEDFTRLQIIRNYQSQGYPDQFIKEGWDSHKNCLEILFATKLGLALGLLSSQEGETKPPQEGL